MSSEQIFYTLSSIARGIQKKFNPNYFWVKAEISSINEKAGHYYLDLIETNESSETIAKMQAHIWRSKVLSIKSKFKNANIPFPPQRGIVIGFQCQIIYHPVYGLSLNIADIDTTFILGEMERKRIEILDRLKKEELLHKNKQKIISILPNRIGLITSSNKAAYSDFVETLLKSGYGFEIYFSDAFMQGMQSELAILKSLNYLERIDLDLVVIIRGGGSNFDLSSLDNYLIAKKIANYKYPVWTGIGHETDNSVLDQVANVDFKTPTAVAEKIIEMFDSINNLVMHSITRLSNTWKNKIIRENEFIERERKGILLGFKKLHDSKEKQLRIELETLNRKVGLFITKQFNILRNSALNLQANSIKQIEYSINDVDNKLKSMLLSSDRHIKNESKMITMLRTRFNLQRFESYLLIKENELSHYFELFEAKNPRSILSKGYAIVCNNNNEIVKSINDIIIGDVLKIELMDGLIYTTVNNIKGTGNVN